ncbi:hypothetical protein LP420_13945 [Massilia sp. B-10]|nr:hypothetical protein LP420_13945 [Massilia sp. B-10]
MMGDPDPAAPGDPQPACQCAGRDERPRRGRASQPGSTSPPKQSITLAPTARLSTAVRLAIVDNGPGFAPRIMARLRTLRHIQGARHRPGSADGQKNRR